ncbi:hypothetical protein W97_03519 [Coniosporium apollinis CBS 100218]|uniref:Apoptosis regulator Bcl-2 family BH4 domain-containing protein n=1 Tax=Coniosporium apollinis (strain CBS 100218) TaxID=1168221 RepID=R7YR03_CONA1|nr:uncharacterized protein W97_03519 [Coniosporium apollinis CBS 100218]EON64288.1 hypothetical protein W97_03519 [Coniosporium apollinis CBS 100218]
MFTQFSRLRLPTFGFGSKAPTVDIPPVEIHDVEEAADKRPRTLKHLIRANHVNHSIIYHNLQFHNHNNHILGSAYILGASPEHLNEIYDKESKELEPWHDSPGEISKDDWRDFLGKREYQRAFVDYFEDQLVQYGYDWKQLVHDYMFEGKEPLINSMISGLGHPLIHLGYGFELSSRTVAIEALAHATCFHNYLHKYLDDPSYTKPSTYTSRSVLEILKNVSNDKRFDDLFAEPGADNIAPLLGDHEAEVLEHWNAWQVEDPRAQFEESQKAAVALLVGTPRPGGREGKYDFFIVHLLTSSHAVRILLPLIPAKFQVPLVRQWWLFALAVYVAQLRPAVEMGRITEYELGGRDWKFVVDKALKGPHSLDAHYVKACRAMKEAAHTWGDKENFYLKAAVKFADEFDSWGGFGAMDEEGKMHERRIST